MGSVASMMTLVHTVYMKATQACTDESSHMLTQKNQKTVPHPILTRGQTHGSYFHWIASTMY